MDYFWHNKAGILNPQIDRGTTNIMSDERSKKIEKGTEKLFYGSQEMPTPYSVGMPGGLKTGKSRPQSNQ